MPFPPELQARIDKARGNAPDAPSDELSQLRAKLAARRDQPGFKDNVSAIAARIAEIEGTSDD